MENKTKINGRQQGMMYRLIHDEIYRIESNAKRWNRELCQHELEAIKDAQLLWATIRDAKANQK